MMQYKKGLTMKMIAFWLWFGFGGKRGRQKLFLIHPILVGVSTSPFPSKTTLKTFPMPSGSSSTSFLLLLLSSLPLTPLKFLPPPDPLNLLGWVTAITLSHRTPLLLFLPHHLIPPLPPFSNPPPRLLFSHPPPP